jgi:hypothetical protein
VAALNKIVGADQKTSQLSLCKKKRGLSIDSYIVPLLLDPDSLKRMIYSTYFVDFAVLRSAERDSFAWGGFAPTWKASWGKK